MKKFISSIISAALLTASLTAITANAEDKLTKEKFLDLVVSETEDFSDGGVIYGKDLKYDAIETEDGGYQLIVYGIKQEYYTPNISVSDEGMKCNFEDYSCAKVAAFYSGVEMQITPATNGNGAADFSFDAVCYVENVLPGFASPAESIVEASLDMPYDVAQYIYPKITAGDTDGDGSITSSDASNVLLAYAYTSTGENLTLNQTQFDYNKDGLINSADASEILAKYAELSTSK